MSVAEGTPQTGAELGRRFGRTDRWGRMQISKARAEPNTGSDASRSPSRNGNEPPPSREGDGRNRDSQTEHREPNAAVRPAEPVQLSRNGRSHLTSRPTEPVGTAIDTADGQPAARLAASQEQPDGMPVVLTVVRWLTALTVLAIALAAGRASYDHQRAFAEMAGEDRNAWSLPLSVDGMMIVASLTMLVRRWQNKPAGQLAWAALLLGGLASLGANITVAEPTMAGRLAAAWPPLCLLVSIELLLQQIRDGR